MFQGKKVIIFDMDGTLIDSVGIWNEVDARLIGRLCGGTETSGCLAEIQKRRDDCLRQFSKAENPYLEYCGCLKEAYHSDWSREKIHEIRYEIAQDYLRHVIDYKKDADVLLKKLKAEGYVLAIATTTKRSNMDIYRTCNENIKKKANLDDYFTLIYTKEDAKELKPNPEIYVRVMEALHVTAEECLAFEDSLVGIEAAKGAGIETVAVYDACSDGDREEINRLADDQIQSFTDILTGKSLNLLSSHGK